MIVHLGSDPLLTLHLLVAAASMAAETSGLSGIATALAWALGFAAVAGVLIRAPGRRG